MLVSLAIELNAWKVGDWVAEGGEGSRVSAYLGKYGVPYGELKHSGRMISWAPAREASRTRDWAWRRLVFLSAPGMGEVSGVCGGRKGRG